MASHTHHITSHSTPLPSSHLFNPTLVHLHPSPSSDTSLSHAPTIHYSSRRARKARYAPRPHQIHHPRHPPSSDPDPKHPLGTAIIRVRSAHSKFKPHLDADVSFWIAVLFTVGSVVWVINGLSPFPISPLTHAFQLTRSCAQVSLCFCQSTTLP